MGIFLVVLAIALIVLRFTYMRNLLDRRHMSIYEEELDQADNSPSLYMFNGCGTTFRGTFREYQGTYVTYEFLAFVLVPIIPIGCYRVRDTGGDSYSVYGSVKWDWFEILCIYMQWFVWIFLIWAIFFAFN